MMRKGRSLTVFAAWILALVMAVCVLPASAENVSAEPLASTAAVESDTAEYEQNADTAINQIKRRNYPEKVAQYTECLLRVGINYDKQQKTHQCVIESLTP